MARFAISFCVGAFVAALFALIVASCTPAQREAVAPGVRASCVVLRALAQDGTVDEVCATAEELAPIVVELLSERAESPAAVSAPLVAFSLPPSPRRVPRRRCVSWVAVGALAPEGGTDGGAHD